MFTVQGEGRGHMTQAIALQEILQRHNHQVVALVAGSNPTRSLPPFFERAFAVPVRQIPSPGFSVKNGRQVSMLGSLLRVVPRLPAFRRSLSALAATIQEARPDLIINFLEPLLGLYNLLRPHQIPVLAVGHQFMIEHPRLVKSPGYGAQRIGMKQYVRLTGARSARLALSFYAAPDIPEQGLFVCPPLLRRQLFELKPDNAGGYLLVYLLNHGYAEDIVRWHLQRPEFPIHCFYDKPGAPEEEQRDATLTFHRIHGEKFLRMMAACRGVACTAGFESVSEAAYLGKPLLMVPVENHFEQHLNACDAESAGLGLRDDRFRLWRLLGASSDAALQQFKTWVDSAEATAIRAIEATVGAAGSSRSVTRAS
jgi:uncharacterized protein (TIGR00661 family)